MKIEQRNQIVSKKLLPLISYWDYDARLRNHANRYVRLNPKKAIIFVAEDKGKLIGYIHGSVMNKPKMVLNKIGTLEDWFVDKEYRGTKIGKRLWEKLLAWFRKKGCKRLETNAYTTNKRAINIYHKLGFMDLVISLTRKL
jgi:GNAT superfamily N-acetyltransferase